MIKNGLGGANTNKTGLRFERKTSIIELLKNTGKYQVVKNATNTNLKDSYNILFDNKIIAQTFPKYDLYKFLETININWKLILSKRLLPDNAIYNKRNNTIYIIEVKYQEVSGSTDEKLQTCDFKLKQYLKLFSNTNIKLEYLYVLNDWFKNDSYKDVLNYIKDVNCNYYFNVLPLNEINL